MNLMNREIAINRVCGLDDEDTKKVLIFIAGLEAGCGIKSNNVSQGKKATSRKIRNATKTGREKNGD